MPTTNEVRLAAPLVVAPGTVILVTLSGIEPGPTLLSARARLHQQGPGETHARAYLVSSITALLDEESSTLLVATYVTSAPATSLASPTTAVGPFPPYRDDYASFDLEVAREVAPGEQFILALDVGQLAPPLLPETWNGVGVQSPQPLPLLTVDSASLRAIPVPAIATSVSSPAPTAAGAGSTATTPGTDTATAPILSAEKTADISTFGTGAIDVARDAATPKK